MEYRILGKTGLKISRLGFGGIPIQRIDAEGTKKLLHEMVKKESIILIRQEDIQSAKNIWDMLWKESVINLWWQPSLWQGQKML